MPNYSSSGNVLAQASDPGAVGAGSYWADTDSGITYRRNDANTAWLELLTVGGGTTQSANRFFQVNSGGTSIAAVSEASIGAWEILDTHTASGTESTYTYTPGATLTVANYSQIMVVIDIGVSAALALQAVINGSVGTTNDSTGFRNDGVSDTMIAATSAAQLQLVSSTNLSAANAASYVILILSYSDSGTMEKMGRSIALDNGGAVAEYMQHWVNETTDGFTSINIKTSASTWKANTRITTFGLRRT